MTRYAGLTTASVVETASYTYDANGNVTDLQYQSGTVVLEDFAGYDNANWLSTETDNGGTPTTNLYDADGQLTGVSGPGAASYTFDAAGNPNNTGETVGRRQ